MKKILQVLLGIAMVAAAVLSCKKDEIKQETLEVSPSEDLQFLAKGNEDAVLTISASASSYEVDAEDWVITRKNGNKLSVNVRDNKSAERSCDMTISAGTAEPVVTGCRRGRCNFRGPDLIAVQGKRQRAADTGCHHQCGRLDLCCHFRRK